jgi:hypothetical protein
VNQSSPRYSSEKISWSSTSGSSHS